MSEAADLRRFIDAVRECLGLAPLGGEPKVTDRERFYRTAPEHPCPGWRKPEPPPP